MTVYTNIWKLYVIKALKWFMLVMPIAILFFQDNGLNLKEVMMLQGVYSFALAIMEIPSGYIADVFGRKHTLSVGAILCFLGFLIISSSYSFWYFLIGEIILGIGSSFISGSDSALLYDSLSESKKEKEYTKVEGISYGIGNFSEALAGICGGILAEVSLRLPWQLQVVVAGLIIPLTFLLKEPSIHKESKLPQSFSALWSVVKFSLIENRLLKWLIILSSIIGFATLSLAWLAQPYFKSIGLSFKFIGISWAILNLATGFSSMNAYRIESKLTQNKLLLLISIGICIPILLLYPFYSFQGLALILIVYLVRGIGTPVLRNYINEVTSSNIRATVLSIRSFCIRLTFSILAPFLGWIADIYSLKESFLMLGLILIFSSFYAIFKLKKLTNN